MHIQTDRALIPAATPSDRYLHVLISAPPAPAATAAPRAPVDVALVLDRSGSMGGSKMQMARTAVQHAIRLLKPQDHLAVVCYDDQVDTVLARTSASAEAKTLALDRLTLIDARGSTNLSGGWLRGAEELQPTTAAGVASDHAPGVKRVLLLTDGLANQGIVDAGELAATASRLRSAGVSTSTFGVGADFDEALLARLAVQGGGHFYYIEQARQIPDFFASELGEALEVVAHDAMFEIRGAGVEVLLLNDLPTQPVSGGFRVRLGDLVADQEVALVVAVRVNEPLSVGAAVGVTCRLADRDHALFAQPMMVGWTAVTASENDAQPVNHGVIRTAAVAIAARARSQALEANRREAFDEARRILKEAAGTLRALSSDDPAVQALVAELAQDDDVFAHAMLPAERKQRHYASYAVSVSREADGKARRKPSAS